MKRIHINLAVAVLSLVSISRSGFAQDRLCISDYDTYLKKYNASLAHTLRGASDDLRSPIGLISVIALGGVGALVGNQHHHAVTGAIVGASIPVAADLLLVHSALKNDQKEKQKTRALLKEIESGHPGPMIAQVSREFGINQEDLLKYSNSIGKDDTCTVRDFSSVEWQIVRSYSDGRKNEAIHPSHQVSDSLQKNNLNQSASSGNHASKLFSAKNPI